MCFALARRLAAYVQALHTSHNLRPGKASLLQLEKDPADVAARLAFAATDADVRCLAHLVLPLTTRLPHVPRDPLHMCFSTLMAYSTVLLRLQCTQYATSASASASPQEQRRPALRLAAALARIRLSHTFLRSARRPPRRQTPPLSRR
jgi:hypothetical protein